MPERFIPDFEITCWQNSNDKGVIDLELFVQDGPLVVGRLTIKALSPEAARKLAGDLTTALAQRFGGVVRPDVL